MAIKKGDALFGKAVAIFDQNQDSAIIYIQQAKEVYQQGKAWEGVVNCTNALASTYYFNDDFEPYQKYSFSAYKLAKQHLSPSHPYTINSVNNINAYYYSLGNLEKSTEILNDALKVIQRQKFDLPNIALLYNNLANSHGMMGDFPKSIEVLQKVRDIQLTDSSFSIFSRAQTLSNIAHWQFKKGAIDEAIRYYEASLEIIRKHSPEENAQYRRRYIYNYQGLTQCWLAKDNPSKAIYFIDKAHVLQPNDKIYRKARTLYLYGKVYQAQKNYREALAYYQRSLDVTLRTKNSPTTIAKRYNLIAEVHNLLNEKEQALQSYQSGLRVFASSWSDQSLLQIPDSAALFIREDMLLLLAGKAQVLYSLYEDQKDIIHLKSAQAHYKLATQLVRNLRQKVITIEAKNILSEKSIAVHEGAIRTALDLYDLTEEKSYLDNAFYYAESNKALLLLEAINEQAAKGWKGLPDSLLSNEKEIRLEIAFYEKKIREEQRQKGNAQSKRIKKWQESLFQLEGKLDRLTSYIEKTYPRFFELKYKYDPIDLPTLQRQLNENNQVLLEYFKGNDLLYAFTITPDEIHVQIIEQEQEVMDQIDRLRPSLIRPPVGNELMANYQQFTQSAHRLFQLLLEEPLRSINAASQSLTIIPDDRLNYIPFDLLLTKAAPEDERLYGLRHLEYVLEKYTLSYDYSATLWHRNQQARKQEFQGDYIGFAPSFGERQVAGVRSCTSDKLYSLQCSQQEVMDIGALFNGAQFLAKEANKNNFEQNARSYRIIHMATHACVDEDDPLFNKIYLSDDYLSNSDLYNLQLDAELAVLSACNTG
ncbi:MAG: CHAT domain-containing tetratricopeptide repeat protein, partial [Bacteroidota bacterium]